MTTVMTNAPTHGPGVRRRDEIRTFYGQIDVLQKDENDERKVVEGVEPQTMRWIAAQAMRMPVMTGYVNPMGRPSDEDKARLGDAVDTMLTRVYDRHGKSVELATELVTFAAKELGMSFKQIGAFIRHVDRTHPKFCETAKKITVRTRASDTIFNSGPHRRR